MATPDRDTLLGIYRTMVRIRTCDELLRGDLARGELAIFHFPTAGHEAIAAGVAAAIRRTDYLVATYRGLHLQLAKGAPIASVLAEVLGRTTGTCGGKGGNMHVCDVDSGALLATGVVGSGLPMATGVAMGSQVLGDDRVTICAFGDGATNTGAFHEAVNLAAVWGLPLVFVCENNRFAETTRTEETYRCGSIADRGRSYGIPAEQVDGYDPLALYEAVSRAVARARRGDGPTVLEALCFRFWGHFFGDPMENVPPSELEAERAKDPIPAFGQWLVSHGVLDEADRLALHAAAAGEATEAFNEAKAAPMPPPETACTGAYSSPILVR